MKIALALFVTLSSFSVFAQTPCDSVDLISIQYSPFTDSLIIVEVSNESQIEIFSYPGFVLLDDNDDTLAVETVNYFGVTDQSLHTLSVRNGIHNPSSNFTGRLELHTNFYDVLACSWDINQSLCASTPCETVIVGLQNYGGALVIGDFHWSVENEFGLVADSGSFTMEAEEQYWLRDICLTPGSYVYNLTPLTSPSGGGPTLTVQSSLGFASPSLSEPLDWFNDPGAELEFPFFEFCSSSPNTIDQLRTEAEVLVVRNGESISLQSDERVSSVLIYSMDGKLIHSSNPNSTNVQLPSNLSIGAYLLQLKQNGRFKTLKIIK